VEKRYSITQQERGLHTLFADIGGINSGNSEVPIPDAARKIEPKRAEPPGIRGSKTDSNIHIRNRTAGYAAGGHSRVDETGDSGPERAGAPPSLELCGLVRKDPSHALRSKTFTSGQNRMGA
jgi:hypothetical protein